VNIDLTDGVAPVLDITAPADNGTYGDTLNITGTVYDYLGAGNADYVALTYSIVGEVTNQPLSFTSTTGVIDDTIDTSSLSGDHTLIITAKDSATPQNQSEATVTIVHE